MYWFVPLQAWSPGMAKQAAHNPLTCSAQTDKRSPLKPAAVSADSQSPCGKSCHQGQLSLDLPYAPRTCRPTHLQPRHHTSQQATGRDAQQLVSSGCLASSMGCLIRYHEYDCGSRPLQPVWPHVLATGHQDDLRDESTSADAARHADAEEEMPSPACTPYFALCLPC